MALILVNSTGIFSSPTVKEHTPVAKGFFGKPKPVTPQCNLMLLDCAIHLERGRVAYKNIAWSGDQALFNKVHTLLLAQVGVINDDLLFSIVMAATAGTTGELTLVIPFQSDFGVGVKVFHAGTEGICVTTREGHLILIDGGEPIAIYGHSWNTMLREYWELTAIEAPMAWQVNLTTDVNIVSQPSMTRITGTRKRSLLAHSVRNRPQHL